MSRPIAAIAALVLAIAVAVPASAADPVQVRVVSLDPSEFPSVSVITTITDAAGKPIENVSAAEVLVSEDGRPQRASFVRVGEQRPVALVVALDVSGSMVGKPLADAKAALGTLVGSLAASDSAALVTFNAGVTVAQPLTTDKARVNAAIAAAAANGNTAVFDATNVAIDVLAGADPKARRAIVLLTDGVDNSSGATVAGVSERMRAQGYPLYVVGLGTNLDEGVLRSLAGASAGGALYVAPTSAQLSSIYAGLAQEIRVQYVLGYRSDAMQAPEGTNVTLTVQVVRAGTVLGMAKTSFAVPKGRGIVRAVPTSETRVTSAVVAPPEGGSAADPMLIALLGTAATLCLLLWLSTVMETRSLFALERTRLARFVGEGETDEAARRSLWARAARPALLRIAAPFGRWAPTRMVESTRSRLTQSGGAVDLTPAEFIGLRFGLAFVLAIVPAAVFSFAGQPTMFVVLMATAGGLLGYLAPGIWLARTVRGRQYRILRALPSALDMLALSAGAGMTLDGAVGQVAQRWRGPLSDEFRRMLLEFNMGRDRKAALRALGDRTGVPEVARFANAIIQADALGTPISRVLQEQSVEMRTRRRQRAEEAARKAPVKMLFPMVGLIFPALFVVILGPAVPRFMDLFQQVR